MSLNRKGKYLIFTFDKESLIFHLGLTGALILNPKILPENLKKHQILILFFEDQSLLYCDIRKFGKIFLMDNNNFTSFLTQIGPDALELDFQEFKKLLKNHRLKIKTLLLNQKIISGLGNIYTDEVLFRSKISPERLSHTLSEEEITTLYQNLKNLLEEAIALRGSSIKNYVDGMGERGKFQERHLVYGRKGMPCPACGHLLEYKKISQRGTTFCPICQK